MPDYNAMLKNRGLNEIIIMSQAIRDTIVRLAAKMREHIDLFPSATEEVCLAVEAERTLGIAEEFLKPYANQSAFARPLATDHVPLVSLGQGDSRHDIYESDPELCASVLGPQSSALAELNIPHGSSESREIPAGCLSGCGVE